MTDLQKSLADSLLSELGCDFSLQAHQKVRKAMREYARALRENAALAVRAELEKKMYRAIPEIAKIDIEFAARECRWP